MREFCFDTAKHTARHDPDGDPLAPFSPLIMDIAVGAPEVHKNVVEVFRQAMDTTLLSAEPVYPQHLARFYGKMGRSTRDQGVANAYFVQALQQIDHAMRLNVEAQTSESVLFTTKADVLQNQVGV